MLEISHRNGSYSDPLVGPRLATKECQTEQPLSISNGSGGGAHPSGPSSSAAEAAGHLNGSLPNGVSAWQDAPTKAGSEQSAKECCKHCSQSDANLAPAASALSPSPSDPRPVSVASSTDSEDTTEEEDEVIFNTIKRGSSSSCKIAAAAGDAASTFADLNSTTVCKLEVAATAPPEEKVNGEARLHNGGGGGGGGS